MAVACIAATHGTRHMPCMSQGNATSKAAAAPGMHTRIASLLVWTCPQPPHPTLPAAADAALSETLPACGTCSACTHARYDTRTLKNVTPPSLSARAARTARAGTQGMCNPNPENIKPSASARGRHVRRVDDAEVVGGERVGVGLGGQRAARGRAAHVPAQALLQALLNRARRAAHAPPQRQLPHAQAARAHRVQVLQEQPQPVRVACRGATPARLSARKLWRGFCNESRYSGCSRSRSASPAGAQSPARLAARTPRQALSASRCRPPQETPQETPLLVPLTTQPAAAPSWSPDTPGGRPPGHVPGMHMQIPTLPRPKACAKKGTLLCVTSATNL